MEYTAPLKLAVLPIISPVTVNEVKLPRDVIFGCAAVLKLPVSVLPTIILACIVLVLAYTF